MVAYLYKISSVCYRCSECLKIIDSLDAKKYNVCPWCGSEFNHEKDVNEDYYDDDDDELKLPTHFEYSFMSCYCSNCGETFLNECAKSHCYCPSCGEKINHNYDITVPYDYSNYEEEELGMRYRFAPDIVKCQKCGNAFKKGYIGKYTYCPCCGKQ